MAELDPVVPGEPIDSSTFGNPVIDRVLSRYADATDRDTQTPLPQAGDFAFLEDIAATQVYDGAAWSTLAVGADYLPLTGGDLTGVLGIIDGSEAAPSITRPGQATGFYTTGFPISGVTVNGVKAAEFRATSTFFPVAGDSTIANAPNAYLRASDGFLAVSTAVVAFLDPGDIAALDARTALTTDPEGLDLLPLIGHLLDRIEALEAP